MRRRDFFWYRKIGEKERSAIGFVRAIGEVGIFWVWVFMIFVRSEKRRNGKGFWSVVLPFYPSRNFSFGSKL